VGLVHPGYFNEQCLWMEHLLDKCLLYKNRVQGAIINVYNKILQANLKKKYENELRINFTVFVAS
jgi:hypothetical protein